MSLILGTKVKHMIVTLKSEEQRLGIESFSIAGDTGNHIYFDFARYIGVTVAQFWGIQRIKLSADLC